MTGDAQVERGPPCVAKRSTGDGMTQPAAPRSEAGWAWSAQRTGNATSQTSSVGPAASQPAK